MSNEISHALICRSGGVQYAISCGSCTDNMTCRHRQEPVSLYFNVIWCAMKAERQTKVAKAGDRTTLRNCRTSCAGCCSKCYNSVVRMCRKTKKHECCGADFKSSVSFFWLVHLETRRKSIISARKAHKKYHFPRDNRRIYHRLICP